MTAFFLVRHGAHDLLGSVLAGRVVDVPLNAAGHLQARGVAERLLSHSIKHVFSSPRRRARETAAAIADALLLKVETADELDEHDAGAWAGQTFDALAKDPGWRAWNTWRGSMRPPGGESMTELLARILRYLDRLAGAYPGQGVVLVSHAEPIRAALLHDRGIPLDAFTRVDVPVASVHALHRVAPPMAQGPAARAVEAS